MSRSIGDILRGRTPVTRKWDVTPVGNIQNPAILTLTDLAGIIVDPNTGVISTDLNNLGAILGPYGLCTAKTNIDLSQWSAGSTFQMGYEVDAATDVNGPYFTGMAWVDSGLTAAEAALGILGTIAGNPHALSTPYLLSASIGFGPTHITQVMACIATDSDPSPAGSTLSGALSYNISTAPGSKQTILLSKAVSSMGVGLTITDPDGVSYDLLATQLANNPVFAGLTLFYFVATVNVGNGGANVAIKPDLAATPPSYIVAGTDYATAGGTNNTWNALFPNITQPIIGSVTQATYPVNTYRGEILQAYVNPSWTQSNTVRPYGVLVADGQRLFVDNVTPGDEAFSFVVSPASLSTAIAGVNSSVSALTTTVTGVQSSLTMLQGSIASLQDGSDEVLVYVRGVAFTPVTDASVTYNSFDSAYNYLITLPKYIRKRIILDDRADSNNTFAGSSVVNYHLMENNITISTYQAFAGDVIPVGGNAKVSLMIRCSSLRLDKFAGNILQAWLTMNDIGYGPFGDYSALALNTSITLADNVVTQNNFVIGDNCRVYMNSYNLFHDQPILNTDSGGTIFMGDNSSLTIIFGVYQGNILFPGVNIVKGANSYLLIDGNLSAIFDVNTETPDIHKGLLKIISPFDVGSIQFAGMSLTTYDGSAEIAYTDANVSAMLDPSFKVVRNFMDFGTIRPDISLPNGWTAVLLSGLKYFIAGTIYQPPQVILYPNGYFNEGLLAIQLLGIKGSSVITGAGGMPVVYSEPNDGSWHTSFISDGVDFTQFLGTTIVSACNGTAVLKNCYCDSTNPFPVADNAVVNLSPASLYHMENVSLGIDDNGARVARMGSPLTINQNEVRLKNVRASLDRGASNFAYIAYSDSEGMNYSGVVDIDDIRLHWYDGDSSNNFGETPVLAPLQAVFTIAGLNNAHPGAISINNVRIWADAEESPGYAQVAQIYCDMVYDYDNEVIFDHTQSPIIDMDGSPNYALICIPGPVQVTGVDGTVHLSESTSTFELVRFANNEQNYGGQLTSYLNSTAMTRKRFLVQIQGLISSDNANMNVTVGLATVHVSGGGQLFTTPTDPLVFDLAAPGVPVPFTQTKTIGMSPYRDLIGLYAQPTSVTDPSLRISNLQMLITEL